MPKLQAFSIDGVECWFWSADHGPPHFHARKPGEWEVRVSFLETPEKMIEVLSSKTPPKKLMNSLTKNTEDYRVELLEEWKKIHTNQ